MLPIELQERLVGRVVTDYYWPGLDPRALAGCCGRVVTGVRWIRGNGHMLILFDAPRLPDEPPDLLIPVEGVGRVNGGQNAVSLWGAGKRKLTLAIGPGNGHK